MDKERGLAVRQRLRRERAEELQQEVHPRLEARPGVSCSLHHVLQQVLPQLQQLPRQACRALMFVAIDFSWWIFLVG